MYRPLLFLLLSTLMIQACGSSPADAQEEEPAETEMVLEDTLELKEGAIPLEWVKVTLNEAGYYMAFPKAPREKKSKSNHRVDYKLKRNKYRLYTSITNLEKEPSFKDSNKHKDAYYDAVLSDLAEDTELEVTNRNTRLFHGIYEGVDAQLKGEDVIVYIQCVLIGNDLFTFTLVLFAKEHPVYDQLRDKFFYSFGKELIMK